MVVLFSIFWVISILFSIIAVPVHIPTNSVQGFPFLRMLSRLVISSHLFCNSHSNRCHVVAHHGFDLNSPDDEWCGAPFYVPVVHLYVFLGEMSVQVLCPFFNWIIWFFCLFVLVWFGFGYWILWVPYIVWILTPYQICGLMIFSPISPIACLFILFQCLGE